MKDIETSIENLNFNQSITIFEDIHKNISNEKIFSIISIAIVFKFNKFLNYVCEKHFKSIEKNIDLISYLLLCSDNFELNDNFYVHHDINYSTDNYKIIEGLIKNNKIKAVEYVLDNYKLDSYIKILDYIIKYKNLNLLKKIKKINVSQKNINNNNIISLKQEEYNFYYYFFFNFLKDKSVFQKQYYLFAFEQNDIKLFEKILCNLNTDNNRLSLKSIMRFIIKDNHTDYLNLILEHKEHFNLFEIDGHIIHTCLNLKNVDCLKIIFSYQECIDEFNNNILNSKNEYGSFLNIAKNLILLKNF